MPYSDLPTQVRMELVLCLESFLKVWVCFEIYIYAVFLYSLVNFIILNSKYFRGREFSCLLDILSYNVVTNEHMNSCILLIEISRENYDHVLCKICEKVFSLKSLILCSTVYSITQACKRLVQINHKTSIQQYFMALTYYSSSRR